MLHAQEVRTIAFALCYLLSNCDDENVTEHFEIVTGSENPEKWGEYIHRVVEKSEQLDYLSS